MKNILLSLTLLFPLVLLSQGINQKAFDEKRNNEMLVGICNREGFKSIQSNFDSVYQQEYSAYKADAATLEILKKKLRKVKVKVVMATWCGDSKDWIPRFYKVMDQIGYDEKNITLICVDHQKRADVKGLQGLKIERVPTFIFYKRKRELGRIIETPSDILEKSMLEILK
jgi:thiol-disulfide isomerase/thioredoxin